MATRLSVKTRKRRRDQATAYKNGTAPKRHKVATARKKKALKRNQFAMT